MTLITEQRSVRCRHQRNRCVGAEAMRQLPVQQRQAIELAFFGA
jgi:hypothetical protein